MKRSGAQIIWECLVKENIKVIFGYPGGANLPIYDAMRGYPQIHHVLPRHEQGGGHMADGYARVSGKVGVAMGTSGPGATNLVTAIATAHMDSIPMVFITAQVTSKLIGYDAFQETDVTGITLPITKHNYLVTDVYDIMPTLREAFYIAKSGRPGPVLVDITKDAQQAFIEDWEYDDTPIHLKGYRPDFTPALASIKEAAALINSAKKPVILAGHGILMGNAMKEFKEFAEKAHAPIAMTLLGMGAISAHHHLNMGMMGMHGESWVNHAIQDADLILAFGMRFDDRVTGNLNNYAKNAKKIHIEIDPSEVNKNVKVDVGLIGNIKEILTQLNPFVEKNDRKEWLKVISDMKGETAVRDIVNLPDNGHLYAAQVVNDIRRLAPKNTVITTDVGQHQMWTAQYFKVEDAHTWVTSGGLGTMGFGLPSAIGAKFASPESEVWTVCGDGGFQMTAAELSTIAQEEIKVNIAIINNGFLGMVRQWQEFFYDKNYASTPMKSPDFVKLAEAHGLKGIRVTKRSEVEAAIKEAQAHPGSVVIDFKVEQEDSVYPMVPAGASLHEMIRRPSSIVETPLDE